HGVVKSSIISNSGIYTGEDVIRMILAGADAVQVVSTVYKIKIDYITTILSDISKWMESNNYSDLTSFRGKLSNKSIHDPFVYKRAQYVDILMKSEDIMTKYPLR
ncbi:MAG TPA: dihydroorotate dehydrogenase, partial [Bacteroidales bacterium]|nr:dihydroorotate dehydrogenase [Bacteroidales bacterium]